MAALKAYLLRVVNPSTMISLRKSSPDFPSIVKKVSMM